MIPAHNVSTNASNDSGCEYPSPEDLNVKFPLVAVFGTSISVISFVQNLFFFFVLICRRRLRRNPSMFYLTLVVFVDLFISVSYVCIMTVQVLYDYLPSLTLYLAWMGYFRQLLTVSTVSLACSAFLIVAWTLERFLSTVYPGLVEYSARGRCGAGMAAVALGALVRTSTFREIDVVYHPHCPDFAAVSIHTSDLVRSNYWYRTIWMFWIRNLATVILPFSALAYMNLAIVRKLRSQYRSQQYMRSMMSMCRAIGYSYDRPKINYDDGAEGVAAEKAAQESEAKRTYKDATFTIVGIVNVFILATLMDVVVASWELVDRQGLTADFSFIYETMADITSISKVVCGALRLPVGLLCNSLIRQELRKAVAVLGRPCRSRRRSLASPTAPSLLLQLPSETPLRVRRSGVLSPQTSLLYPDGCDSRLSESQITVMQCQSSTV